VLDLTATLTPAQVQALAGTLESLEKRKGSQLAVLIVPSTQPEAIEQYSMRVAEAWKLAGGDVCQTVLKYNAGHQAEKMTEAGAAYCARVRGLMASASLN